MGVLNDHIHDFIGTLFEDAEDPDLLADMVVNAVEAYRSVAPKEYVVFDDKECLFWSNDQGWVGFAAADRFTQNERDTLSLPDAGEWRVLVGGQWPVRERDEGDPHLLTFVEDVTRETSAVVTSDGHLRIDGDGWDFVEVHETSVWCAHCGLLGTDGQRAHGLLDDWEQV